MAILYVIGTPIGNLEDITLRALCVLKEADIIVCEDTRVTQRLLKHYGITNKQLVSYNEQKSGASAEKIIKLMEEGKNLALVTDAGTPGISDPGAFLISQIREYFSKGIPWVDYPRDALGNAVKIESVPGPSALTAALSIAGVPAQEFLFLGFLPHKKGRETLFKEIAETDRVVIFYESPHRLMKTLESLKKSSSGKTVSVAKELTKIHENVVRGSASEVLKYFGEHKDKIRGEFVVIISD
ncbi:MAG: 16S rRNA (cytidine(1402)-2'-O)-methyltransferase [Patescibacteria group bacterium]